MARLIAYNHARAAAINDRDTSTLQTEGVTDGRKYNISCSMRSARSATGSKSILRRVSA